MHALNFNLKRAHWSAVRAGKKIVEDIAGMTPARFDILYKLRRIHLHDGSGLTALRAADRQSQMWKDLGLHRSTISKLVRKLEAMGWIWRERDPTDRRTWAVRLTELGLRRIFRAMRLTFQCRPLLKEYEEHFAPKAPTDSHVVERIDQAVRTVRGIARWLGDRSQLWYDYGCRKENLNHGLAWKFV